MRIAGIYLAAGQSRRMTVPKLSLELAPGNRLGAVALTEMLNSKHMDSVLAVARDDDKLDWVPELETALSGSAKLEIIRCRKASLGMSYSIREGLIAALAFEPHAIMIVLADQPFVTTKLLDDLVTAYQAMPKLDFVACEGDRVAMPPALFAPTMFEALSRLEGDAGARKLLASSRYKGRLVRVDSPIAFADVDTPSDLEEARRSWNDWIRRESFLWRRRG